MIANVASLRPSTAPGPRPDGWLKVARVLAGALGTIALCSPDSVPATLALIFCALCGAAAFQLNATRGDAPAAG